MSETWSAFALLAERHGFVADPARPRAWSGGIREALVRFEVVPTSPTAAGVRVVVQHGRKGLVVTSVDHALAATGRRLTGDPAFDDAVWLSDPDPTIHGFLDAPRRARVVELVRHGAYAQDGELRLEPWAELDADLVEATVGAMAEAAHALATTSRGAAIEALTRLAAGDPLRTVRAVCRSVADHDADVRDALARAATSTAEGPSDELFAELAHQVRDGGLATRSRNSALGRMLELFPLAHCEPVFAALPAVMQPLLARALVRHLREPEADTTTGLRLLSGLVDPRRVGLSGDDQVDVAELVGELRDELGLTVLSALFESEEPRVFTAALGAAMRLPITGDELVASFSPRGLDRALELAPEVARQIDDASGELLAALFDRLPAQSPAKVAYLEAFAALGLSEWSGLAAIEARVGAGGGSLTLAGADDGGRALADDDDEEA